MCSRCLIVPNVCNRRKNVDADNANSFYAKHNPNTKTASSNDTHSDSHYNWKYQSCTIVLPSLLTLVSFQPEVNIRTHPHTLFLTASNQYVGVGWQCDMCGKEGYHFLA